MQDPSKAERQILTVTQLNRLSRQLLETHLSLLWVEGEISNLARPASGHAYFTLKDQGAQIRCAMFKNRSQFLRIQPRDGMKVLVRGRVSIYEGRGDYQLIVEHMEDAGLGALQRAFEMLRNKLAQEGLFAQERKRPLPIPPKHLAVITSATGAALRDILAVFKRRHASLPITVIPVPVQGKEAPPAIVKAIAQANTYGQFDVILLARGGGSLEDLWAFNEEVVARAIATSKLPVITGVGHETDTTIADFVADLRAPTPSAAAEMLSPDAEDWFQSFIGYEILLREALQRIIRRHRERIAFTTKALRLAQPKMEQQSQRVDHLEYRLRSNIEQKLLRQQTQIQTKSDRLHRLHPARQLQAQQRQWQHFNARLVKASPLAFILQKQQACTQAQQRLTQQMLQQQKFGQQRLTAVMQLLHSLSPLQTLERGFAILTDESDKLVTNANQVKVGQTLRAQLKQGELQLTVIETALN